MNEVRAFGVYIGGCCEVRCTRKNERLDMDYVETVDNKRSLSIRVRCGTKVSAALAEGTVCQVRVIVLALSKKKSFKNDQYNYTIQLLWRALTNKLPLGLALATLYGPFRCCPASLLHVVIRGTKCATEGKLQQAVGFTYVLQHAISFRCHIVHCAPGVRFNW